MSRECFVCGKKAVVGGSITHRGIAKKQGGIGLQLVKNNKRIFKPNLQKIKITVNGSRMSKLVCTACIRSGFVTK
jgi:large subunit ribosomal protein L28